MAVALRCPFREVRARARPLLALLVVATAGMALLLPSGLLRSDGVLAVFVMQRSRLGRRRSGRRPDGPVLRALVLVGGALAPGTRGFVFFDSWNEFFRVLVMAALAYPILIAAVRASGKRTLSKMNAFDLVVTVALGSTLATILLNRQVALWEGAVALGSLVTLQFVTAWASVRFRGVRRLVKAEPTLLLHEGRLLHDAMRGQRVTPDEVRQAIRAQGTGALELVHAVVLETDGSFSVISRSQHGSGSAMDGVRERRTRHHDVGQQLAPGSSGDCGR
ncbi:YetF domain-containing protein [Streptomyces tunisiensis]|uniref:YetF domain-containing protein n=1 Tax=Streptomyces tunisiensis TaxID=948699 RepID=UPI00403E00A5